MSWLKKLFSREPRDSKPSFMKDLIAEFNAEQSRIKSAGSVEDGHYTDHIEQVKELKREKRHSEAIDLLLKLIDATESEAETAGIGWGVAPWYYEQLAIIYRKEKLFDNEVAILERYKALPKAPGVGPSKLAERLAQARALAASNP